MKKMLQRSISIILALSLCLVAMQFTALADTVTKAGLQTLSEWIEMADDLLSQGKEYASGKTEFDAAYNSAKSILESESASDEAIIECIEGLKNAWAGLKIETVTEIAPDGGIANNTGCEGFGSSYTTVSGKRPTIKYTINATGADFRADIEMIYVYAYGYQTASVTEELISGTTLPKGGTDAAPNGVRLSTTDYSKNAYPSNTEGWVNRARLKKIEFSKEKLSNFIAVGELSQIMFCYLYDSNPDATLCAGSLFIVRSAFEQVPVSYELYKWVNRAENLLSQGKTYVAGLNEFNAAIYAAKNATAADDVDTLIANIKTTWQALEYLDVTEIAPIDGVENNTGCTGFGNYYKTSAAVSPKVQYVISDEVRADLATATEIYVYAYGYKTEAGTNDIKIYENLYQGKEAPEVNLIRICDTDWADSVSSQAKFTRGAVRKYTFARLPEASTIQVALNGTTTVSNTIVVGSLFIVKGERNEKLPSDRLFNWIDRAEKILDMDVTFTKGIDEFNTAVEALYNADTTADEDALIADLKAAWNNLTYEETVVLGTPTLEGAGTNITESYTKEDDRLGDSYVCVQSNGKALAVRFDRIGETAYPINFFDDITEIYFYIRGYQTNATTSVPDSNWTMINMNSSIYVGSGPNVSTTLKKATIDVETFKKNLTDNNCKFQSLLLQQGQYTKASTWIVGTLYATKTVKLSLADYGDLNSDGTVDVKDLVRAKKYFIGSVNDIAEYSLDMNDDDKFATDDLVSLRKKILNIEVKFADNYVSEQEIF